MGAHPDRDFEPASRSRRCGGNPRIGAVASFIGGMPRRERRGAVSKMTSRLPGKEKALEKIVAEARARWEVMDVLVVHRVGELKPTDRSCWSWWRRASRRSLRACEFSWTI